jgi:hypothetical protein
VEWAPGRLSPASLLFSAPVGRSPRPLVVLVLFRWLCVILLLSDPLGRIGAILFFPLTCVGLFFRRKTYNINVVDINSGTAPLIRDLFGAEVRLGLAQFRMKDTRKYSYLPISFSIQLRLLNFRPRENESWF